MKPLNLREYAEALALTDDREFALEIIDHLDIYDELDPENFMYDINNMLPKELHDADNWRKIENIGDRLQLLSEIQDMLSEFGLPLVAYDEVRDLIEQRCKIEEMLEDARWLGTDKDIVEAVAQLLGRVPEYDL
jgi:hypothetical protein